MAELIIVPLETPDEAIVGTILVAQHHTYHPVVPGPVGTVLTSQGEAHVPEYLTPTGGAGTVGPAGPKGDTGATGATGATGPAGTTDYTLLSNTPTLGTLAAKNAVDYSTTDIANKPTIPTALASLTDDTTHRLTTDTQQTSWTGKEAGGAVSTHAALTTGVHGAGVNSLVYSNDAKLSDARTPVIHDSTKHSVTYALPGDITTHAALTTGVHGAGANSLIYSNDSRLSDARTPVAHTHAPADVTGTAVVTADSRLSDARTPLAHTQAETTITFTDVTTSNVSTSGHGFAPKAVAPAANSLNALAIANGETVFDNHAILATTVPSTLAFGGAAAAGTALEAAHVDHAHGMPANPAPGLTVTNSKTHVVAGNFGIAWAKYAFATNGGVVSTITPGATVNTTIPANAILVGATVNVTTACTSSGSGTLAIGCAGTGGATTTLLAATAVASLTSNAVLAGATTFAAPKKLTGAGGITFTIGTAALTAGVVEVFVFYWLAAA